MKNSKFFLFLMPGLLCLFLIQACTNLEVKENDSVVVTGTDATTAGDPAALLASAYTDLGEFTNQDFTYSLFEHVSDEMIPPTRGVDWGDNGVWRTLHAHTWDATHSYILGSWNRLNSRVFKCNQGLAASPTPEQAAQMKFLRAFYMYHIMDLWGQVPFRNVDEGVDVNPRVLSRSEAFDFVEKDLLEALPNLPVIGPVGNNTIGSRAAANMLLSRLYLNKAVFKSGAPAGPYSFDNGDMAKVIQYCDAVTADGFSLDPDYFNIFKAGEAAEVIFNSPEGSPQNRVHMTLHYDQNPSGWNGFATLADFYAKFQDGDQRKGKPGKQDGTPFQGVGYGFLIGQQYDDNGQPIINSRSGLPLAFTPDCPLSGARTEQGIRVMKYHAGEYGKYILMRYGEVVLNKAEAQLRSGDAAGALATVNGLRAIRGATALGSIDLPGLLDERGRELYWEGYRRDDQVRFETFDDTWSEKTVTDKYRVLYPIPQQALDSNPNLKQNDGY